MSQLHVKLYLLVLLLLTGLGVKSQNVDLVLKVADELYENDNYYGSIQFYEKALNIDSSNTKVLYKYGRNLSQINNHKGASRYLLKAYTLDRGKNYPMVAYELAEAYRQQGEYRKSRRYYNYAMKNFRTDRKSYWYQRINQDKKAASWASKNKSTTTAQPNNLGKVVNSNFSEFGGTIHGDQLFFSAMVADSVTDNYGIRDKHYFSRIYKKNLADKKEAEVLLMDKATNKLFAEKHLANPSFLNNDVYFSVCDSNFKCEIWKGKLINNELTQVEVLNKNINYPTTNNTQPCISVIDDQTVLFFVSDRKKGFGGLDIWKSNLELFGFDEAINVGSNINTPGQEITPFYNDLSKEIYFSSDWHYGYGGYDIFKSKLEQARFQPSENIGKGINSSSNEYYFQPYGKVAILSSNRLDGNIENSSSCCNDLYEVDYTFDIIEEIPQDSVNEEILNKYLPLTLYFHNDVPNPNSKEVTTNANYINLATEYVALKEEYIKKMTSTSKKDEEDVEFDLSNFFEADLNNGIEDLKSFTPLLLSELEKGNKVALTIRGYASSISNSSYNLNLTLRRIESLVNYFMEAESGAFKQYILETAENGGTLEFVKLPYGDFAVEKTQNSGSRIDAVYSLTSVKQRKIELLALSSSSENSSINVTESAELKVITSNINLGSIKKGEDLNTKFQFSNSGKGELKIYNISSNLENLEVDYPKTLQADESGLIQIDFPTENLKGKLKIELLIVSNANENLKKVIIECLVVD